MNKLSVKTSAHPNLSLSTHPNAYDLIQPKLHDASDPLQVGDLPTLPDISGDIFLSFLGVDPNNLSADVIVLALGYAGFVLAALGAMLIRSQREARM